MKKILFAVVCALCAFGLQAQNLQDGHVYVSGQVGTWRNTDANKTSFTLIPEIGYHVNPSIDLGLGIGYHYNYQGRSSQANIGQLDNEKTNALLVSPYVRWNAVRIGAATFFVDGGFSYGAVKVKQEGNALGHKVSNSNNYNAWEVALRPGVKFTLNSHVDFIAHFGALGYRDADDGLTNPFGENGFGFNFSANNLTFGLNYTF